MRNYAEQGSFRNLNRNENHAPVSAALLLLLYGYEKPSYVARSAGDLYYNPRDHPI